MNRLKFIHFETDAIYCTLNIARSSSRNEYCNLKGKNIFLHKFLLKNRMILVFVEF